MIKNILKKILLILWTISISLNLRYIIGPIKEFGQNQHWEYLKMSFPLWAVISFILLLVLVLSQSCRLPKFRPMSWILVFATILLFFSSVWMATDRGLALYWTILVLLQLSTVVALTATHNNRSSYLRTISSTFIIIAIIQAGLGILQFTLGHTLGLHYLGEIVANDTTLGVAKVVINSHKLLRPVGLFPHANIFGGFLLISLLIYYLFLRNWGKSGLLVKLAPLFLGLLSLGTLLSFSRSAWLGLLVLLALGALTSKRFRRASRVSLFVILVGGLFFYPGISSRFVLTEQTQQIGIRTNLYNYAVDLIREHPLIGLGPRNFVLSLSSNQSLAPYEIQPVHNSFLFVAAEVGIPLLIILVFLMLRLMVLEFRKKNYFPLVVAFSVLPILFLDHYFLSLTVGLGFSGILLVSLFGSRRQSVRIINV